MSEELKEIPLEDIYWPDETDITEEQIKNMAASIAVHGVIQPIVVDGPDENGKYRGVCGRLRYEGMKRRNGKTILARVLRFKDEAEIKMWQLAENLHRREITAMQKAKLYRKLYDLLKEKYGEEATIQTLASAIEDATGNKESVKTIQHYLSLTKLEPEVQEILTREKWPLRWGLELLRIKDPKVQTETAKEIHENKEVYDSLEDVKYRVDEILAEERRKRRDEQLRKKAEQLRKETGKEVYVDRFLSWEDREKFHEWWDPEDRPEECKSCENTGILLTANFQQKPICLNPECWEKKSRELRRLKVEEEEARRKLAEEECRKIWDVDKYDVRHYRLAVLGLIDEMELADALGMNRWSDAVKATEKVMEMSLDECLKLLMRKAAENILLERRFGVYETIEKVKRWAVETFNLKRELFLGEEASENEEEDG